VAGETSDEPPVAIGAGVKVEVELEIGGRAEAGIGAGESAVVSKGNEVDWLPETTGLGLDCVEGDDCGDGLAQPYNIVANTVKIAIVTNIFFIILI
jgi:hypothetical protein